MDGPDAPALAAVPRYRIPLDPAAPAAGLGSEWLLTNGLGGFAMGTPVGANTRRYHGLLVAATTPPTGRVLAVHSLVDRITVDGEPVELAAQQFIGAPDLHPGGSRHLVAFEVEPPHTAVWTWRIGSVRLRRRVHLVAGVNRIEVTYVVSGARSPLPLSVRPLLPLRGFHDLEREGDRPAPEVQALAEGIRVRRGASGVDVRTDGAAWEPSLQWWRRFSYGRDAERGQASEEDVPSPGVFHTVLEEEGARVTLTFEVPAAFVAPGGAGPPREPTPPSEAPPVVTRLAAAADQFVVTRPLERGWGHSIIAGYPWFADWGRDAMIGLPGLLFARHRLGAARSVLETFARHRQDGLLPNCFHDALSTPQYNAADAGLWFVHAVATYVRLAGSRPEELLRVCHEIVDAYVSGTRFGIGVDDDGLVRAGDGSEPVTWMDAQRDGVAFTPRDGKAVEINALWSSSLRGLAALTPSAARREELEERAERAEEAFRRAFWWPERGCLHDCLRRSGDGAWRPTGELRPNQIFAVSLPHSPLSPQQQRRVVDVVGERLLTPYGLRTLDRDDPGYCGRFAGDLHQLDAAYHNGTVWPWLIGPYCDALLRTGGADGPGRARAALAPLLAELDRGCVGQLAEVYDGDAPHREGGCPAQAWSVAEVLRIAGRLA